MTEWSSTGQKRAILSQGFHHLRVKGKVLDQTCTNYGILLSENCHRIFDWPPDQNRLEETLNILGLKEEKKD